MNEHVLVVPITPAHPGFAALRAEAAREGFSFVDRLALRWETGANRFEQPGECLLGAIVNATLVGVGGLNRDPYATDGSIGRLRHLYVMRSARRRGVGRLLVDRLVDRARPCFARIRLRTDTPDAAAFYLARGFEAVADEPATHGLTLR